MTTTPTDTDVRSAQIRRIAYTAATTTTALWAGSALMVSAHPAPWTIVLALSATAAAVTAAWFHSAVTTVPARQPAWRNLLSIPALRHHPVLAGTLMAGAYCLVHAGVVLLGSPNAVADAARFAVIAVACFALHRAARRYDHSEPTPPPTGERR